MSPDELNAFITAAAVLLGLLLKRWDGFETKFIPVASFVLAAIIRLAAGLGIEPAEAGLNAVLATGIYSGGKNILEGVFVRWAANQKAKARRVVRRR